MTATELKELEKMIDMVAQELTEEDHELGNGGHITLAHRAGFEFCKGILRLAYKKQPINLESVRWEAFKDYT